MSKYKNLRPAGMSDDDSDHSEGGEYFGEHCYIANYSKDRRKPENDSDDVLANKEHDHEKFLINACTEGDLKALQDHLKILDVAYDINKFLHTGWTLLLHAVSSVQPEIIEYLLTLDADPNKDKEGYTPLMALCGSTKGTAERSLKCLTLLIQAKADANLTNKQRETALMYACMLQNAEFVAELIKHVQDINVCDSDWKSALIYAAAANKPDIVKILLEYNADISFLDKDHLSAKDIADKKGFTEVSTLLAGDEEEEITTCEVFSKTTWKDLFPDLYPRRKEILDDHVLSILSGMGLESYKSLFLGVNFKTFLHLTEDEICHLGIDITVHREQFLEHLEKFHLRKWNVNLLGSKVSENNINPIYDNIILLMNAKEMIAVIGASFQYIKNNFMKAANENIHFSPSFTLKYEEEIRETRKNLKNLKNEIILFKQLAQKIDKENDIGVPAIYIYPQKNKSNWTISLSVMLIVGLCLYKSTFMQKRIMEYL